LGTSATIRILSVSPDFDPFNWSKIKISGQYPELETLMSDPTNPTASVPRRPDPNEKLVKVFDSEDESEAMIVKGLLESAGIDSDLTSATLVQDTFPGLGGMIILVREQDAEAARKLIEENRQPESSEDDETAEIDIMEDSPKRP
jgi:Putative prokaryotic signal transducing protein